MNKIALPNNNVYYIALCDNCEVNEATMVRGHGIYYSEICGNCRLREVMSRP